MCCLARSAPSLTVPRWRRGSSPAGPGAGCRERPRHLISAVPEAGIGRRLLAAARGGDFGALLGLPIRAPCSWPTRRLCRWARPPRSAGPRGGGYLAGWAKGARLALAHGVPAAVWAPGGRRGRLHVHHQRREDHPFLWTATRTGSVTSTSSFSAQRQGAVTIRGRERRGRIERERVVRLATIGGRGRAQVALGVFTVDGEVFCSPADAGQRRGWPGGCTMWAGTSGSRFWPASTTRTGRRCGGPGWAAPAGGSPERTHAIGLLERDTSSSPPPSAEAGAGYWR